MKNKRNSCNFILNGEKDLKMCLTSEKSQIPNPKSQTNLKFQIQNTKSGIESYFLRAFHSIFCAKDAKTQNGSCNKFYERIIHSFKILNFEHLNLFGILKGLALFVFITSLSHASTGSLWPSNKGMYGGLFSDSTAGRIGDLITIVVNLSSTISKDKSMDTSKDTAFDDSITALGFSRGTDGTGQSDGDWDWFRFRDKNPAVIFDASQTHAGEGTIEDTETLTTTIQARVVDVLPNGTMQVEAKRVFEVGKEKSIFVLSGLVRREDLGSGNTVSSTKVADLQIKQEGTGPLTRSTKKGWLTTLYEYINPF